MCIKSTSQSQQYTSSQKYILDFCTPYYTQNRAMDLEKPNKFSVDGNVKKTSFPH